MPTEEPTTNGAPGDRGGGDAEVNMPSAFHGVHQSCEGAATVSISRRETVQGDNVEYNTGNGEKLSYSQVEPGQASCLGVA